MGCGASKHPVDVVPPKEMDSPDHSDPPADEHHHIASGASSPEREFVSGSQQGNDCDHSAPEVESEVLQDVQMPQPVFSASDETKIAETDETKIAETDETNGVSIAEHESTNTDNLSFVAAPVPEASAPTEPVGASKKAKPNLSVKIGPPKSPYSPSSIMGSGKKKMVAKKPRLRRTTSALPDADPETMNEPFSPRSTTPQPFTPIPRTSLQSEAGIDDIAPSPNFDADRRNLKTASGRIPRAKLRASNKLAELISASAHQHSSIFIGRPTYESLLTPDGGSGTPLSEQTMADLRLLRKEGISPEEISKAREERAHAVLCGDITRVFEPKKRIVRIFTSSTFTDTKEERNALMAVVYDRLGRWSQRKYGISFQVVDMRWGVRDQMTDDHKTTWLCMKEVQDCQRLSLGPTFVTFVGEKYGYRPFPPEIEKEEFESLLLAKSLPPDAKTLLSEWFLLDRNQIPPHYVLQSVSSMLPDSRRSEWWPIFLCMHEGLELAAHEVLSPEEVDKYRISVTETEIRRGIFQDPDRNRRCFWFRRVFVNSMQELQDRISADSEEKPSARAQRGRASVSCSSAIDVNNWKAPAFVDMVSDDAGNVLVDDAAQLEISRLRQQLVDALHYTRIFRYEIDFDPDQGVNPLLPHHSAYLRRFCSDFERAMRVSITDAVNQQSHDLSIAPTPISGEASEHIRFCLQKARGSVERDANVLKDIIAYCKQDYAVCTPPLVVYGTEGTGKTTVMAQAAVKVHEFATETVHPSLVVRFVGVTSESSSARLLIHSLCEQVSAIFKDASTIPQEYIDLTTMFPKLCSLATPSQPLFIFLDSVDLLNDECDGRNMQWLPSLLPASVRVVVSTVPSPEDICFPSLQSALASRTKRGVQCFVEVKDLSQQDGSILLDQWLKNNNRALSIAQTESVLAAFQGGKSPLYMSLVLDISRGWRSYTTAVEVPQTVEAIIHRKFDELENAHGPALVSHALGYIVLSRSGLSENELLTILSRDDAVLNSVFQYWTPPSRKLPPMLWLRVRRDLGIYLVERFSDEMPVYTWYHRQFERVARLRYYTSSGKWEKVLLTVRLVLYYSWLINTRQITRRVAAEYPWLLRRRLKDKSLLRNALLHPNVFMFLYTHNKYDLLWYWKYVESDGKFWSVDAGAKIAEAYAERLKQLANEKTSSTTPEELAHLASLIGRFLKDASFYRQALSFHDKALPQYEALGLVDEAAQTLGYMGHIHQIMGDYEKAEEYLSKSVETTEKLHGSNLSESAASILNNLAMLKKVRGELKEALTLYERILAIYERLLGPVHPYVATACGNLGTLYQTLGDFKRALRYFLRDLSIGEKVLGKEHPDVAATCCNLGGVYQELGDYAKASEFLNRALAIDEDVYGGDDVRIASTIANLASLRKAEGNLEDALKLFTRALNIRQHALGSEHAECGMLLVHLSSVHSSSGNSEPALELAQKGYDIIVGTHGLEHGDSATAMVNLGTVLQVQERFDEATPHLQQGLAVVEKIHGETHPEVAQALNNLAQNYMAKEEYEKAIPLMERDLASCEKLYGPTAAETAGSLNNLGALFYNMENYARAKPLFERALKILEDVDPNHPDADTAREWLSDWPGDDQT